MERTLRSATPKGLLSRVRLRLFCGVPGHPTLFDVPSGIDSPELLATGITSNRGSVCAECITFFGNEARALTLLADEVWLAWRLWHSGIIYALSGLPVLPARSTRKSLIPA